MATDFGFELTDKERAWLERQATDDPIPDQVLRDAATLLRAGRKARHGAHPRPAA